MSNKHLSMQEKVNKLVSLYEKNLLQEAFKEAKSLANQHPNVPVIYNIYGIINIALGNWKQSAICFSKAIKIKTDYTEAHHNLGIALDNLGQLKVSFSNWTPPAFFYPLVETIVLTFLQVSQNQNFYQGNIDPGPSHD